MKMIRLFRSVFSNSNYIARLLTPELLMENSLALQDEIEHKVAFSPWIVLSAGIKKLPCGSKMGRNNC
jgi:hypothetical protein